MMACYEKIEIKTRKLPKETVVQRCSIKKVFLEISQNSQDTPVPEPRF